MALPVPTQQINDAVMASATKKPKTSFSEFTEKNMGAIQQWSQFGIGLGSSIADTVREQKIKKEEGKQTLNQIKQGIMPSTDTTGGGGSVPPAPSSDTILGMSKPVFFGGIGVLIVIAGVGIYFATKGGEQAAGK